MLNKIVCLSVCLEAWFMRFDERATKSEQLNDTVWRIASTAKVSEGAGGVPVNAFLAL